MEITMFNDKLKNMQRFNNLCEIEKIVAFHVTGKGTFKDGKLITVPDYPSDNPLLQTINELFKECV